MHACIHYITLPYLTLPYHYITLHYITLHYHYITLHHITSHHITSHYITLHYMPGQARIHRCCFVYIFFKHQSIGAMLQLSSWSLAQNWGLVIPWFSSRWWVSSKAWQKEILQFLCQRRLGSFLLRVGFFWTFSHGKGGRQCSFCNISFSMFFLSLVGDGWTITAGGGKYHSIFVGDGNPFI